MFQFIEVNWKWVAYGTCLKLSFIGLYIYVKSLKTACLLKQVEIISSLNLNINCSSSSFVSKSFERSSSKIVGPCWSSLIQWLCPCSLSPREDNRFKGPILLDWQQWISKSQECSQSPRGPRYSDLSPALCTIYHTAYCFHFLPDA